MRVLVCGGRYYENRGELFARLDEIHAATPITLLITGACPYGGADGHAEDWAKEREVVYVGVPARFKTGKAGRGEGPLRNQRMLDEWRPELVVSFEGGTGTADMVRRALSAEIGVVASLRREP